MNIALTNIIQNFETRIVAFRGDPKENPRVSTIRLQVSGSCLELQGSEPVRIFFADIRDISLQRINGLGTTIRIGTEAGDWSIMVPRINLFGYFVIVNMVATKKLHASIEALWKYTGPTQHLPPSKTA